MSSLLLTVLSFVVVLGVVITIHEFGHFAMAKLLKIRVLVFSIGFGPRLVGTTRGGTDYRICALPLGGYVKMAGETYDENPSGEPDEFLSHPRWHRFLVAIAGPLMNIVLAITVATFSFIEGVRVPHYLKGPAVVGPVVADSIASRAGLNSGDRIISVRGNDVNTWEDLEIALGTISPDSLDVIIERGRERIGMRFDPPAVSNVSPHALGFKYTLPYTKVFAVDPNSAAHRAGLRVGDELLRVDGGGNSGQGYDQILNIISMSKGVPLTFEVRREVETLSLTIVPADVEGRILIGFVPEVPSDFEKYGVTQAIWRSVEHNYKMSALVFTIIGRIITGSASVRTLSGPIEIARFSGTAARTGSMRVFAGFLGLVSLQLGVFNLLPIPILDGGVIALLLVEGIIRRDLSLAVKEKLVQVGFVFLVLLMGFVLFNDLLKVVDFEKLFR